MVVDRSEVENFLYREARLMDEHAYSDWLALFTDDARYWVPSNDDAADPVNHVSIIYDDRNRMTERVFRLTGTVAHSQEPRSRTSRMVSNVELGDEEDGELTVYANFNLTQLRRGRQQTFAGRTVHKLRQQSGSFKIALRKVFLVNNDEPINNLTFLV
jgi:3-phenylpropionate/cinnamic acid dioxygenase small subunit